MNIPSFLSNLHSLMQSFGLSSIEGFPGSTGVKKLPANTGNLREAGLIPGVGKTP